MIARHAASIGSALVVTLALLLLMQAMITSETGPSFRPSLFEIVDYIAVERPPPAPPPRERVQPPAEPRDPPPTPRTGPSTGEITVEIVTPTPPETDTRFDRAGPFIDGELLPIVTVAPSYPPRARAAQIEGHVVVEFTVTLTGAVKDAIVVESTHTAFERASIEAVQKFRYRPRVVDGQPVEVRGIRKRFTFVLEE